MLIGGGVLAGLINTLAGGGSFLSVPLLVLLGLPPTVANATNRVGVLVQSATAVAGFRQEGVSETRLALRLLPATLAGSWLGAWLSIQVSDEVFSRAFGLIMLLMLPLILRNPRPREGAERRGPWAALEPVLYFAIGCYGGAFQAGIGIPLILALVGWSGLDMLRAAGARVFITAALTLVCVRTLALYGLPVLLRNRWERCRAFLSFGLTSRTYQRRIRMLATSIGTIP